MKIRNSSGPSERLKSQACKHVTEPESLQNHLRMETLWKAVLAGLLTASSAVRMHDESQLQSAAQEPPGRPKALLYATEGFWGDSLSSLEDTIVTCYTADNFDFASCIRKKIREAWSDDAYNVVVSTSSAKVGWSLAPVYTQATFEWGNYSICIWSPASERADSHQ